MLVLGGSITVVPTTIVINVGVPMNALKKESPRKTPVIVIISNNVEELRQTEQYFDLATATVLMVDSPKKSENENGHVWDGTEQVFIVTTIPSIIRHQFRVRLNYSKAKNAIESSAGARKRASFDAINFVSRDDNSNSPPSLVITSSAMLSSSSLSSLPRTVVAPKAHVSSSSREALEATRELT